MIELFEDLPEREAPTEEEVEKMHDDYIRDINRLIRFKCKPTYNFQSVEFEYESDLNHLGEMFEIYKAIVNELMIIAPEQPAKQVEKVSRKVEPAVEMPTKRMYEVMDHFGIKYTSKTTKAEASKLISDNMSKDKGE